MLLWQRPGFEPWEIFPFQKLVVCFGSGCEYTLMHTRSWIGHSVVLSLLVHLFVLHVATCFCVKRLPNAVLPVEELSRIGTTRSFCDRGKFSLTWNLVQIRVALWTQAVSKVFGAMKGTSCTVYWCAVHLKMGVLYLSLGERGIIG